MEDYEKDSTKVRDLIYLLGICPKGYVIRTRGDDPRSLGAINLIIVNHREEAVTLYSYSAQDCQELIKNSISCTYRQIKGILYEERISTHVNLH